VKIAYVTPRYGEEVVGGAEHAARMLAERLHDQLQWDIEVFTSCALDAATWQNHFEPGTVEVNRVRVHRFASEHGRHPDFLKTSAKVHANPKLASIEDQKTWIQQQGPFTPSMIPALQQSDADLFAFYPYLYYPTVYGIPAVKGRAVMHPAAHDEIPIRMSLFASVFAQTNGFVFQTDGERRLVESLFPLADRPQMTLGLGVDPQNGDVDGFRQQSGIGDRPYVVCVGRVDDGKGTRLLAKYFTEYKRRHPGPLQLALVGPVMNDQTSTEDIVVTGPVSEVLKWGALRGAKCLVSPSAYEAFSIVLLEAWAARNPAIVNAACLATREHVQKSRAGLWFDGYLSFETALEQLLQNHAVAESLAAAGIRYVDEHFRWPDLIARYGAFLESLANRARR
jgi:glycosyltransferase involved in cell wall biosynthesis